MALNYQILVERLNSLFSNPPPTTEACVELWASAIRLYSQTITPPSVTSFAASEALKPLLTLAFKSSNALPGMSQAFLAWAQILGSGMAPTFTGVPPLRPIDFSNLFSQSPSSHLEAAQKFALVIHSWTLTGTATNNVSGVSVNWF